MAPHSMQHRKYRNEDRDREYYEHECQKFRICIIGKTGVGKSTLLSRVFGMDEQQAGVVHPDEAVRNGGGKHNVFNQIIDENRNSALIIHDSCGFETGEGGYLDHVQDFIDYRSKKPSLSEQLHCIWYCISLTDARPLHDAERRFFEFLRETDIPVVFVLTKYDAFICDKVLERVEDIQEATGDDWAIAREAAASYIATLRTHLEGTVGQGVKVQEVSKTRRDEHLVKKLVVETTAIVRPNLRIVWYRAQGVLANQKRHACVDHFPEKLIKSLIGFSSLPLNPFRGLQLSDFFESVFHHCCTVWNLPGQSVLFTKSHVQQMFREASQTYIGRMNIGALLDLLGFIDALLYIKVGIKIACDLIMIFQQLFWATPRRQKLSYTDLERELGLYKASEIRDSIHTLVDGYVTTGNCFSTQRVIQTIGGVVERGCGILHNVTVRTHKKETVGSLDEPPFAELPGTAVVR
ncbi:hypothetical protein P154DRAFT_517259 [Amniculicola lignicola CBS 123094]|uniref:G domain-containing protein n=1 Tax=Amniculicola lignicola CBS 123094 TaxID=1392246 RepID=A0A6A5X3Z6_9PLEO|nr:hypothetical protein P154DRAFT_517259 [Amniculicola lignicola CBS 123094]